MWSHPFRLTLRARTLVITNMHMFSISSVFNLLVFACMYSYQLSRMNLRFFKPTVNLPTTNWLEQYGILLIAHPTYAA